MRLDDSVLRVMERSGGQRNRTFPQSLLYGDRVAMPLNLFRFWRMGHRSLDRSRREEYLCMTRKKYAILSQHIGDMENYETVQFFEETLQEPG